MPVPAPMKQIGRASQPHFRPGEPGRAARSMQRDVLAVDPLRKQYDILVVRPENHAVARERAEVFGTRQGRGDSMPRHGHVRNIETAVQRRDPRVLDPELFERRLGNQNRPVKVDGVQAVETAYYFQIRSERQPRQSIRLAAHHARVDELQFVVGHPIDRDAAACFPARQTREPGSRIAGAARRREPAAPRPGPSSPRRG